MASSSRVDSLRKQYEENPRRYFAALANEYRKAGDLEQAIGLCRAHLPQQPSHISGHIVFGQALFEAGQLDEARSVFEAALGLDPENLIALRHLGDIAHANGDPDTAREWYTRILNADPRNDEIQALLDGLPAAGATPVAHEAPDAAQQSPGDWAAAMDAHATGAPYEPAHDGAFAHEQHAEAPPAPAVTPEPAEIIDVAAPPSTEPQFGDVALDQPFDFVAGGPAAVRDALESESPDAAPEPATPESAFGVELERSGDAGLGLEPTHAPAPAPLLRHETPPIGMEAIFEAEAAELRDVIAPDVVPTAHQPEPDAVEHPAASEEAPPAEEPPPAREPMTPAQMESLFGAPDEIARGAEPPAEDVGVEHMQFVPPEREHADEGAHAAQDAGSAPADDGTPAAFVTETMAELYVQQGFRDAALNVYRQLLARSPHDGALAERVRELETQALASAAARRTARAFFGALALRRAPTREPLAESNGSEPSAVGAPEGPLAADLAGPAHTSEPLAFEGATATGVLAHHGAEVTEADLAAGAPVAATPQVAPGDDGAFYHPPLEEPADAGPASRASYSPTLDAAFGAEAAPEGAPGTPGGSLDRLFEGRGVASGDEAAAASLASAFTGEQEVIPAGKPTRPAEAELSLDHVFGAPTRAPTPASIPAAHTTARPTPAATHAPSSLAPRPTGGFSFDQFFAEAGSPAAAPTEPTAEPGEVAASDIEQFNAWLEGLKKK